MVTAPEAVVDALNALLESQQNSIIRFMGEGSPYLSKATAELRGLLGMMLRNNLSRCGELYRLIEGLGGTPRPRGLQPEEQYLAYLSLKFLMPKLVSAKELILQRYDNALRAVGKTAPPEALAVLNKHRGEHEAELNILRDAASGAAAAKSGS